MKAGLERLNRLPAREAEAALLACCGSSYWAQRLAAQRPFRSAEDLFAAADELWWQLAREDWLEAFNRHPKIGERRPADGAPEPSRRWSAEEQAGARDAAAGTLASLRQANLDYEARFGYLFIVCATGKTAEEMLALLRRRLQNDPGTELRIAAEEQRRITRLRLEKLLRS